MFSSYFFFKEPFYLYFISLKRLPRNKIPISMFCLCEQAANHWIWIFRCNIIIFFWFCCYHLSFSIKCNDVCFYIGILQWIFSLEKPYYPYFFICIIPTFSQRFWKFCHCFFSTFLQKGTSEHNLWIVGSMVVLTVFYKDVLWIVVWTIYFPYFHYAEIFPKIISAKIVYYNINLDLGMEALMSDQEILENLYNFWGSRKGFLK